MIVDFLIREGFLPFSSLHPHQGYQIDIKKKRVDLSGIQYNLTSWLYKLTPFFEESTWVLPFTNPYDDFIDGECQGNIIVYRKGNLWEYEEDYWDTPHPPSRIKEEMSFNINDWFAYNYTMRHSKEILKSRINNYRAKGYLLSPSKGVVYIIKSQGRYKIGKTRTPYARIKSYQTHNPIYNIEALSIQEDYSEVERYLHSMLAPYRFKGEWFNLDDDILLSIKVFLAYRRNGEFLNLEEIDKVKETHEKYFDIICK